MLERIDNLEAIRIRKEILKVFHEYCLKEGIEYSLAYGTLLGAVRHGDMIPWDDDVDVMMTRRNYNRFVEAYGIGNTGRYRIVNHTTHPDVKTRFGYFVDYDTITYDVNNAKENASQNYGIRIDVYPMDIIPLKKSLRRSVILLERSLLLAIIRGCSLKPELHKNVLGRMVCSIIKFICSIPGYDFTVERLHKLSMTYDADFESDDVGFVLFNEYGKPLIFNKKKMLEFGNYEYNGKIYNGIKDADYFLKKWYGNYMELPPEKDRVLGSDPNCEHYWKKRNT